MLKFLLAQVRRFPWVTNVVWYSCIFTAGDLAQQKLLKKEKVDLKQTRNVALLAFSFHGNLFYMWLKLMEHMFPGTAPSNVLRKVVCDQLVVTPTGISGFYIGEWHPQFFQDFFDKFTLSSMRQWPYGSVDLLVILLAGSIGALGDYVYGNDVQGLQRK
eukprot:g47107.t1